MNKNNHGFTLIELIVTLAVFGIVLAIAIPNFNNLMESNRRSANINVFVSSLNLARSEAVKRNHSVSLCTSNDGAACNTALSWEDGWLIFVDIDKDGVVDAADGDVVLRVFEKLNKRTNPTKDVTITEIETTLKKLTYLVRGNVDNTATFMRCDDRGSTQARAIIVSNTGRVRLSKGSTQKDNTTALTCP